MDVIQYLLRPVGIVRSPLRRRENCPKQSFEGAPDAWLEIDAAFAGALDGLGAGSEILLLTWFHEARRDLLRVHPRGNRNAPLQCVFTMRSPDRPNPIGVHRVKVLEIRKPCRVKDGPLEALDGTPVIDIKPVMTQSEER